MPAHFAELTAGVSVALSNTRDHFAVVAHGFYQGFFLRAVLRAAYGELHNGV